MSELLAVLLDTDAAAQQAVEAQLGVFVSAVASGMPDQAHCQRAASHLITVLAGSKNIKVATAAATSAKAVFSQAAAFPDDPETLAARTCQTTPQRLSTSPHRLQHAREPLPPLILPRRAPRIHSVPQACFAALHTMLQSSSSETRESMGRFGAGTLLSTAIAAAKRHLSDPAVTCEALKTCRAVLVITPEALPTAFEHGAPPSSPLLPPLPLPLPPPAFAPRITHRVKPSPPNRPRPPTTRLPSFRLPAGLQQLCRMLVEKFDVFGKTPTQERMIAVAHEARTGGPADLASRTSHLPNLGWLLRVRMCVRVRPLRSSHSSARSAGSGSPPSIRSWWASCRTLRQWTRST